MITSAKVQTWANTFFPAEIKAARTSVERSTSSVAPVQEPESFPVEPSLESLPTQDATSVIRPAKTEVCSAESLVTSSTKDSKAISPATKEASTASVPYTEPPMEVSSSKPLKTEDVGASFMEGVQKEFLQEKGEGVFYRNLPECVKPLGPCRSEEKSAVPDITASLSLSKPSSEETPLKTSVERLAEMISFPCHSPLGRGAAPRELLQTQSRPSLGDHSGAVPTTTLIPLPPKIGMGKPAITKRKFSPGRPRVKQVGSPEHHRSPLVCFRFLRLLCFPYTSCTSSNPEWVQNHHWGALRGCFYLCSPVTVIQLSSRVFSSSCVSTYVSPVSPGSWISLSPSF